MSYSVDIIAQSIFERELSNLLMNQQKEKEPIIEYIRQRIDEIKSKYALR